MCVVVTCSECARSVHLSSILLYRQSHQSAAAGDWLGIHPANLRPHPPGRHTVSPRHALCSPGYSEYTCQRYKCCFHHSLRAKYAIAAVKKKLNDKNPHVALYALEVRTALFFMINSIGWRRLRIWWGDVCVCLNQVLESVVKNCGQTVHDEVASKQTMEELKDLFKVEFFF